MAYEWLVGTRYLMGTRRRATPSIITVISVFAVALGVTALILVLSIMGGFEGDLRTKILGSKSHILITGPSGGRLEAPDEVIAAATGVAQVIGASPFLESDVMITSSTNYSGIVLRGVDPVAVATATDLPSYIVQGELSWLGDPDQAIEARRRGSSRDIDALEGEYEAMIARLERQRLELEALLDEAGAPGEGGIDDKSDPPSPEEAERLDAVIRAADAAGGAGPGPAEVGGTGEGARDGSGAAADDRGRRLPPPVVGGARTSRRLPTPVSGDARSAAGTSPAAVRDAFDVGTPPRQPGPIAAHEPVDTPGILIGTELRDSLHVAVGDVVHVINPDGDLGPTGPIPRSWAYRVVGVFYTGLYEYDNTMVYMTLDDARAFLNIDGEAVTGVELRVDDLNQATAARLEVEGALASAGVVDAQVQDWMELNSRLFSALLLEKVVMGLLLMIIVLVASFAIVCVLIMIVVQRGDEIAILRSMGASAGGVMRVFVVQGFSIGAIGTLIGLLVGLGLTTYLTVVGVPLDPEVYYIDRVPVEVDPVEILAVVLGALGISLLATLYPSVQAARLDPAAGLRYE